MLLKARGLQIFADITLNEYFEKRVDPFTHFKITIKNFTIYLKSKEYNFWLILNIVILKFKSTT